MFSDERLNINPKNYINELFKNPQNGELKITYYDPIDDDYTVTYKMNWYENEAEKLSQKYNSLVAMLDKFATIDDQLQDPEKRKNILTEDELTAFKTYALPFKDDCLDLEYETLYEIQSKVDDGTATEEEKTIWNTFCNGREEEALKRLPFKGCSPVNLIIRAMRYKRLKQLNAPKIIIDEGARCLAEEMVVYNSSVND